MTIWCNADLSAEALAELRAGLGHHGLVIPAVRTGNLSSAGADPELETADIAFGQPDPQQVASLPGLRWVHLTSAGYTRYDNDVCRAALAARGAVMTNSSSVYDEPCAQHLLAFMLAEARELPGALEQRGTWSYAQHRSQTRILQGDKVLILGYGAIGKRLAELLAPFNVEIVALRRRVRGDEPVPTFAISELNRFLGGSDHVVNILPANSETGKLVDGGFWAKAKEGVRFYNVGRGTTVDQEALAEALRSGRVARAFLDVADPEPLPADHFLWSTPNCHITPHIAGGRQEEDPTLVRHFLANLKRFEAEQELVDRIS